MKDYKLSDMKRICQKHTKDCRECPIFEVCQITTEWEPASWDIDEEPLKAMFKKGDIVYHIDLIPKHHPENGIVFVKEAVKCVVKAVYIGKTKTSYLLDRYSQRIDERYLYARKTEAEALIVNKE